MAKPMGMPMAHQAKKQTSIARAGRLIGLELLLPIAAEEPAEPQGARHDGADHEQAKAGVEDVHADMQHERVFLRHEGDVVDRARQADHEHHEDDGGGDDGEDALPARLYALVEHVEGNVLALVDDGGAGEEYDPDIGDRADLERPGG